MEFYLQSENGKRLYEVLANWVRKAPESTLEKLKRAFIGISMEIENEDSFISVLYGLAVLDESPLILSQQMPNVLLRVQYGIETCVNKLFLKELVVALEKSKNENVQTRILSWAEKSLNEEVGKKLSVDLAPQRVQISKLLSQLPAGTVTPRHREIDWKGENILWSVLEICNKKIILGWDNGQIKIYNSADLECQTVLSYCANDAGVSCLQCTCTEIIAGYSDGNICIWNIAKGLLLHQLSVKNENDEDYDGDYGTCMRWRDPKLVVATKYGRVKIWQYVNSSFTCLGSWDSGEASVDHVDFNESYVILLSSTGSVKLKYFNGNSCRSVFSPRNLLCMSLDEGRVISGSVDGVLQVWDNRTGACLRELQGHEGHIHAVDAHNGVIGSVDKSGRIILWSAKVALEGGQAKLGTFMHSGLNPVKGTFDIKLGTSVLVAGCRDEKSRSVVVTDFPL